MSSHLFELVLVTTVCIVGVIFQWLRAGKLVVGGWSGNDISMTGNLPREAGHRTSDLA